MTACHSASFVIIITYSLSVCQNMYLLNAAKFPLQFTGTADEGYSSCVQNIRCLCRFSCECSSLWGANVCSSAAVPVAVSERENIRWNHLRADGNWMHRTAGFVNLLPKLSLINK